MVLWLSLARQYLEVVNGKFQDTAFAYLEHFPKCQ
jgi:hypothetical protein